MEQIGGKSCSPQRWDDAVFDTEDDAEPLRKGQERGNHVSYLLLCRAKIQLTRDQDHKEKASFLLPCLLMKSPGQCLDLTYAAKLLEKQLVCNSHF